MSNIPHVVSEAPGLRPCGVASSATARRVRFPRSARQAEPTERRSAQVPPSLPPWEPGCPRHPPPTASLPPVRRFAAGDPRSSGWGYFEPGAARHCHVPETGHPACDDQREEGQSKGGWGAESPPDMLLLRGIRTGRRTATRERTVGAVKTDRCVPLQSLFPAPRMERTRAAVFGGRRPLSYLVGPVAAPPLQTASKTPIPILRTPKY